MIFTVNITTTATTLRSINRNKTTEGCSFDAGFYVDSTLSSLIFIVNALVSILIVKSRLLRRCPSNFILLSLSLSDLLTGIGTIVAIVIPAFFTDENCGPMPISDSIGSVGYYILRFCLFNSVAHLTLLSSERTLSIFAPLYHRVYVTKRRILVGVWSSWIVCGCLTPLEKIFVEEARKGIILGSFIVFALLPTIFLLLQYIAILYTIYHYHKKRGTQFVKYITKKQKAALIYMVMFLSFLMLTFPFFIVRIYGYFHGFGEWCKHLWILGIVRTLPSLLNPFTYALFKEDFHKEIRKISLQKQKLAITLTSTDSSRGRSRMPKSSHRNNETFDC